MLYILVKNKTQNPHSCLIKEGSNKFTFEPNKSYKFSSSDYDLNFIKEVVKRSPDFLDYEEIEDNYGIEDKILEIKNSLLKNLRDYVLNIIDSNRTDMLISGIKKTIENLSNEVYSLRKEFSDLLQEKMDAILLNSLKNISTVSPLPIGSIIYADYSPGEDFLLLDGKEYPKDSYPLLWDFFYKNGDKSATNTTIILKNYQGRFILVCNNNQNSILGTSGAVGGEAGKFSVPLKKFPLIEASVSKDTEANAMLFDRNSYDNASISFIPPYITTKAWIKCK